MTPARAARETPEERAERRDMLLRYGAEIAAFLLKGSDP